MDDTYNDYSRNPTPTPTGIPCNFIKTKPHLFKASILGPERQWVCFTSLIHKRYNFAGRITSGATPEEAYEKFTKYLPRG